MSTCEKANEVKKELERLIADPNVKISLENVVKTNDVVKNGFVIKNDGEISPVLYIEDVMCPGDTPKDIAGKLYQIYRDYPSAPKNFHKDIAKFLEDADALIDSSYCVLLNRNLNSKKLARTIHKPAFCDIDIAVHTWIDDEYATYLSPEFIKGRFDEEEFIEKAFINTIRKRPAILNRLTDVINDRDNCTNMLETDIPSDSDMLILTTGNFYEGAISVLYPDVLEKISKAMGSFVLIPSSINEFLIVSADTADSVSMKEMIADGNATVVSADEILSDRAYYYNAETKEISVYEEN